MNIDEIKQVLNNLLNDLERQRQLAFSSGNMEELINIQNKISETQLTLDSINKL